MTRRIISLVVFAASLLLPVSMFAFGDDWQPITQEDLKLTSAQAGNANAIILYHEIVSDDVRHHQIEYKRIKILTEAGKKYADVEIPYDRSYFDIVDVRARTIGPDGSITAFEGKPFDKIVVKGHGVKVQTKTFSFPNVQVGSIVEFKYTLVWETGLRAADWILQDELPQKYEKCIFVPYRGRTLSSVGPAGYITQAVPYGPTLKHTPDDKYEFEISDVPAFVPEEFSPPEENLEMRVQVYYGDVDVRNPDEFWKIVGKSWSSSVDKFTGHSGAVAHAAAQAVNPDDTPEQKVRKIYALVQKMRNYSYQYETAPDRKSSPRSAEDVLKRNAGYSYELTELFVALVRALKIPAYDMVVAARDGRFFSPKIPTIWQLNSSLAIVGLPKGEVFLDPGTPLCPFGLLDWKRTATRGLRQTSSGAVVARTPDPQSSQTVSQQNADLSLGLDWIFKGTVTLTWTGQEALFRRLDALDEDEAGRKEIIEKDVKQLFPGVSVVKVTSSSGWNDPESPLQANVAVEIPGLVSNAGKRVIFPGGLFEAGEKTPFTSDVRMQPVYFHYPMRVTDKIRITLAPDIEVVNLPGSAPGFAPFGHYKFQRTGEDRVLNFSREFSLDAFSFDVDQYPALREFYATVKTGDEEQVVLSAPASLQQ